jgi:hypothetical protein
MAEVRREKLRLMTHSEPATELAGFGEWRDKLKDLPEDYWTNPKYDKELEALFGGSSYAR